MMIATRALRSHCHCWQSEVLGCHQLEGWRGLAVSQRWVAYTLSNPEKNLELKGLLVKLLFFLLKNFCYLGRLLRPLFLRTDITLRFDLHPFIGLPSLWSISLPLRADLPYLRIAALRALFLCALRFFCSGWAAYALSLSLAIRSLCVMECIIAQLRYAKAQLRHWRRH